MTLVIIFKMVKDGTSLQFTVSLVNQTACNLVSVKPENYMVETEQKQKYVA